MTTIAQKLRALLAEATGRPWRWAKISPTDWEIVGENASRVLWHPKGGMSNGSGLIAGDEINKADAALIVEGITALPALLDELDQLKADHAAERERVSKIVERVLKAQRLTSLPLRMEFAKANGLVRDTGFETLCAVADWCRDAWKDLETLSKETPNG